MRIGLRQRARALKNSRLVAARSGRQHYIGGAIGSVLNGSRKPRWDTRRATGTLVLLPLGAFIGSMALGAASPLIGVVAIVFLSGGFALVAVEFRQRRRLAMSAGEHEDLEQL